MIYQLYPNTNFISKPFSKFYSSLCLDCLDKEYLPELKMEYSGMIYLWKNNLDNDDWIGFTSHKQFKKSSFILDKNNFDSTLSLLNQNDIICFLYLYFNKTISEQAEFHHKKINFYINFLFQKLYQETIPESFYKDTCGCFANYWIMSKDNFNEFMNWSYPKVLSMVNLSSSDKYFLLGKHSSNTGYIIERMFLIWYMKFGKNVLPIFSKSSG